MASVVFVFGGHFGGPGGACGGGGFGSDDFEVAAFQVRFLAIGGFSWEAGGRGYADRFPGGRGRRASRGGRGYAYRLPGGRR